jgi:hypothetical protein
MEKLVDSILGFPTSSALPDSELSKQAQTLLGVLNRTPAATLASTANGNDLLNILNPAVNSIAYLYVLCVRLEK